MMTVMRILLADDSVLILERLQQMLTLFPQVEIVGSLKNGNEALQAIKILKPDLAILDIKMPGLSGLEVLTEIRKVDKTVKFIILTLYSSDFYKQMAIQSGADYFFSKVDDFEKVKQSVSEIVLNEEIQNRV
jgi:DNA-binding NarL/FixJ family response regulator